MGLWSCLWCIAGEVFDDVLDSNGRNKGGAPGLVTARAPVPPAPPRMNNEDYYLGVNCYYLMVGSAAAAGRRRAAAPQQSGGAPARQQQQEWQHRHLAPRRRRRAHARGPLAAPAPHTRPRPPNGHTPRAPTRSRATRARRRPSLLPGRARCARPPRAPVRWRRRRWTRSRAPAITSSGCGRSTTAPAGTRCRPRPVRGGGLGGWGGVKKERAGRQAVGSVETALPPPLPVPLLGKASAPNTSREQAARAQAVTCSSAGRAPASQCKPSPPPAPLPPSCAPRRV
jgi:hypothetical protein